MTLPRPMGSALRMCAAAGTALTVVLAGLLAGIGWLYVLRGLGVFAIGPSIGDSLPLLQLASFDGQPLLRVLVAWALAGVLAGVLAGAVSGFAPPRPRAWRRGGLALVLGLALLLLASQAAYSVARNLALSDVLFSRRPGAGPVVEACAFAAGAVLAGLLAGSLSDRERLAAGRPPGVLARIGRLHDRRLRRG